MSFKNFSCQTLLPVMLNTCVLGFADVAVEREVEGDLFLHDVGQGLFFKPGTFDGCIRLGVHSFLLISTL